MQSNQLLPEMITPAPLPFLVRLLIGAVGIYSAFLCNTWVYEDVFHYTSVHGHSFDQVWVLHWLEALANVVVGYVGWNITDSPTDGTIPLMFGVSGVVQVAAKATMSLALVSGLGFPVAILAKSANMVVSLSLGRALYQLPILAIIVGTWMVSMGEDKGNGSTSPTGVVWILTSVVCDAVAYFLEKRREIRQCPKPYDCLLRTNFYMLMVATGMAWLGGELSDGVHFCIENPQVLRRIIKFSICSAVGQCFIFYTVASFQPEVHVVLTTSSKVIAAFISVGFKGHSLSRMGWGGMILAGMGILTGMIFETNDCGGRSSGHQHKS